MTVAAPPRPPSERATPDSKPLDRDEIEALVEALIEEARRETRRRHRTYWAVAALATFVGVVVLALLEGGAASQTASPALSVRSSLPAAAATSITFANIVVQPDRLTSDIYVMNADGSGQRELTPDDAQENSPAWSPDGRRIAFLSSGIRVVNADGSGLRRLTRKGWGDSALAWSRRAEDRLR